MKLTKQILTRIIKEEYKKLIAEQKSGTIYLPTYSAIALYEYEIKGQISDGAWENSKPWDHWKFWGNLEIKKGNPALQPANNSRILRTRYDLWGQLFRYIGDRMINLGRLGKALARLLTYEEAHMAEYMPSTLEEFKIGKETGKWEYDFIEKYAKSISIEDATKFYDTNYTAKDLKIDLRYIQDAMQSTPITEEREVKKLDKSIVKSTTTKK